MAEKRPMAKNRHWRFSWIYKNIDQFIRTSPKEKNRKISGLKT